MAKSRIFYWTSVVLRIGIVIQNLIDSRGIGGELLRALMSTFFKHCVLRAEQRSAFLQVSFTYAKIFLAAFVKKRKKKEKRRSPGQFHFFHQLPKNGVDIVFKTLIDLKWQQRLLQTQALAVPTRFFCFSSLRLECKQGNLRAFKVILITVMLAHLQLKQINLSSKLSHNYCWAVEIWPKKNWVEMLLLLSEETEAEILCVPASFSTFSSALLRQHCPDWRMGVISWSSHIKMIPKWPLRNAWKRGEEPFLE